MGRLSDGEREVINEQNRDAEEWERGFQRGDEVDPITGLTPEEMEQHLAEYQQWREGMGRYEMELDVTIPMKTAHKDALIGYATLHPSGKGLGFLCLDCGAGILGQYPIYGVNVNPYKCVCVQCKRVIVEGCGTELLDGR